MGGKRGRPSGKSESAQSGSKKVKEEVSYTLEEDIAN